jgi:hypothetical protein
MKACQSSRRNRKQPPTIIAYFKNGDAIQNVFIQEKSYNPTPLEKFSRSKQEEIMERCKLPLPSSKIPLISLEQPKRDAKEALPEDWPFPDAEEFTAEFMSSCAFDDETGAYEAIFPP